MRLEGGHHRVGVEGRAVVETHTLAQLELHGHRPGALPAGRQAGLRIAVGVEVNERVGDHADRHEGLGIEGVERIERRWIYGVRGETDGASHGASLEGRTRGPQS